MALKVSPPSFTKEKPYESYRKELLAWRGITDVPAAKQGIVVLLSLPEEANGIRARAVDELDLTKLQTATGFDKLLEYMDGCLMKDELEDNWVKFVEFILYKRQNESIDDYIANFDMKYNRIVKAGSSLPSEILAFVLLLNANISREENLLVKTGLDYSDKANLYKQAKKSLKKFKGADSGVAGSGASGDSVCGAAIKLEPAFLAQHEEALWSAGYARRDTGFSRNNQRGRNTWRGPGRGRGSSARSVASQRRVNPRGPDGQPITCSACGSYRHLIRDCPDSWEKMAQVHVTSDSDTSCKKSDDNNKKAEFVLFTGYNDHKLSELECDARNCAVLDSACTSTVCGRAWLDNYVSSLSEKDRCQVTSEPSSRVFKFGGGTQLKSEGEYVIPAVMAGTETRIKTDVVDSDIPLLLSRTAMKKAQVKLDLENDSAEVLGKTVALDISASGHYCLPIDRSQELPVEEVFAVKLDELNDQELHKSLLKLHKQFAHPSSEKLRSLLKNADVWDSKYESILQDIRDKCEICKRYSVTPPRPVVSMPMASEFNERVCIDLKKWQNKWILHIIDMWSRFSVSVLVDSKNTSVIIDNLIEHWVAIFGVMGSILSDNGGEFSSEEMREVASVLNINLCTTPAESPWSNGLCERVHSIIDTMLAKLVADQPNTSLSVLLRWANMAKNALQMNNGFSSYQLVFGKNPNLPNIMCDNVVSFEGLSSSESLVKHLNSLHAARLAFIKSETSERIRRALRSKIRASQQVFEPGTRVFYKREGRERWLGPAKVVFQDGRVVFVRHGSVFVRVSPNRLVTVGAELCSPGSGSNQQNMSTQAKSEPENPHGSCVPDVNNLSDSDGEIVSDCQTSGVSNDCQAAGLTSEGQDTAVLSDSEDSNLRCNRSVKLKPSDMIEYRVNDSDDWTKATVLGRAGKASGKYSDWFNIATADDNTGLSVNLQSVQWRRCPSDTEEVNIVLIPRQDQNSSECTQAKMVELDKLKQFDTCEVVGDHGQKRISTRWVLWRKGPEIRARLVARGFEEDLSLETDSPTVAKETVRIVLSIAASYEWPVKTTDIKSAFLQSKPIERDVYIQPPAEADLPEGSVWRLKRCLYGLNDAARQFYASVVDTLLELGCERSSLDPSLFYKHSGDGKLCGIIVSHIDDFLHCGNPDFEHDVMQPLRKRFLAGKLEERNFSYVGYQMNQCAEGIQLSQDSYVKDMEVDVIPPEKLTMKQAELSESELTQLRKITGKLNWIVQGTRPDLCFELIELSMKFKKGTVSDLLRAVKALRRIKDFRCVVLFPRLGSPLHWRMIVFTDAAHANLCDGVSSTGAYIVFLVGPGNLACPLAWNASKIKRVVKSTIAAEALSLQTGLDVAVYLRDIIAEVTGVARLTIAAYVDNRSVVEAVHSTKMVADKRLRIDIGAIKQSLQDGEITAVRWCPGAAQLANCLTKRGAASHHLLRVFHTGKLDMDV